MVASFAGRGVADPRAVVSDGRAVETQVHIERPDVVGHAAGGQDDQAAVRVKSGQRGNVGRRDVSGAVEQSSIQVEGDEFVHRV